MFESLKLALNKSFKNWMDAFNSLLDKLDELPLPIAFGSNSQMQYLKLANGKVLMWARIDYGKTLVCTSVWPSGNYASANFTINFPIPLIVDTPVIFAHVSADDLHPDIIATTRAVTYTSVKGCFVCRSSETDTSKVLNLLVIGDWK